MATAMYVIQGTNTRADFAGLKGKRVAVVCRPVTSLHFRDSSVSRDLAKQVGMLLEKHVREDSRWSISATSSSGPTKTTGKSTSRSARR